MNKIFTIIFTSVFSLFLLFSVTERTQAQYLEDSQLVTDPGDITFGLGLTQGTSTGLLENAEFGLTAQLYFTITEIIRAGADFTYYSIGERDLGANELNFNAHYLIRNRGSLVFYGLGGINISNTSGSDERWRVERDIGDPNTRKLGLNAGVGLDLRFGNLMVFGESKATLFGGSQFVLTGGVRYIL